MDPAWIAVGLSGLTVLIALGAIVRGTATRSELEAKIKELRKERELVAEDLRVFVKVAQKRADDAHSAIAVLQDQLVSSVAP